MHLSHYALCHYAIEAMRVAHAYPNERGEIEV